MRGKYRPHHILQVVLLFIALAGFSASNSKADENSKYLDAVREFADNVLKYGRDTYGPKHTPLFVDGLNIHTHEPVKWIAPNGDRWILSNLASQQNLFRVLDGLTTITGDPKYRQAAVEAIEYAFANLRSPNGLLYWGARAAYDALGDRPYGGEKHVFKGVHPYYELMWQVDPEATRQIIESFWASHILDWSNLDMNRYGPLNSLKVPKGWDHEYKGGPVFFKSKDPWTASFDTTASDLYHAAAFLFKVSGQKEPLIWGKRLAHRYVETRNPKTGISGWIYSCSRNKKLPPVDESGNWILDFYSVRGNPKIREAILGHLVLSPGVFKCGKEVSICQLMLGEILGDDGKEFKQWALEELASQGRAAYRKKDNLWIPIRTDGTSLEGIDGKVTWAANPADFWAYAMAFRMTRDKFTWQMVRNIAKGSHFGEIGESPEETPYLKRDTDCSNPCAVLGFLELHKGTEKPEFLEMASRIGDNILAAKFHRGFFVPSKKHTYAKFDAIESLVLLNLYIAVRPEGSKPPQVWPSRVHFNAPYRQKELATDNKEIYALMESVEPPVSLDEATSMGSLEMVKSLVSQGIDVDAKEGYFGKTALHHAAKSGHKDVAEFLTIKGADINAKDKEGDTPLHSAAKAGHKDIVELLIAKGADINAKDGQGRTPIDLAMNRDRKEIAKLFLSKSVDVSLHTAAYIGDSQRVEKFIDDGANVDAKDQKGQTALHYAAKAGQIAVAKLLIANGADVNAGEWTPLQEAAYYSKEMVELLLAKGANVNTGKWTALHIALDVERFDIVELLLAKGADANIRDDKGRTPLHIAAWYAASKNPNIVELLLSKGADINAKDNNGNTALSYAMGNGHTSIVELLRKHGAIE